MKKTIMGLLATAAVLPTAAMAQDATTSAPVAAQPEAPEAAVAAEGDIIVTAQKRNERLQDVPKTVDVITGDAVEKLNLRQFSDIQQVTPGLSLSTKSPFQNTVTLRGIGFDPISGTQSTVDVYFNEVPISFFSAFRGLYDVGQIEVLRGPQGTLRGRTSPAGAITIASRRPDLHDIDGYMQQTVTTQDGINTQGAIGVPLIDGVLAVRASGLFDRNNGMGVTNVTNGKQNRDKTESGRISVLFKPTQDLELLATYQHLNNRITSYQALVTDDGVTTDPILTAKDRTAQAVGNGYNRFLIDQVTLGANWDNGYVGVNYIGGYQKSDIYGDRDLALAGTIPNFTQSQISRSDSRTWTHEVRVSSQGQNTWNWLVGGFYSDAKGNSTVDQPQFLPFGFITPGQPPIPLSRFSVNVDTPSRIKDYAVFTDHRFQLSPKDLFEAGIRYQWQKFDRGYTLTLRGPIFGPDPVVNQGISPENQSGTYKQLTGSASFRHEFTPDLTGYISYGRGYRAGGVTANTAQLDEDVLTYKPETSNSYEIGLKGALLDRRVNFTLSVFQQDFNGYQAFTGSYLSTASGRDGVVDNNATFVFNADARVRGVEATISSRITDEFQLGVAANYADAKFRDATSPCNDYNGDGAPDSIGAPSVPLGQQVAFCRLTGRLSDQAPWNLSVNAEYAIEVGDNRSFFVRGVAAYTPKRSDPFTSARYDDLLDNSLFLGFRGTDGSYEFSVFAKNIANVATITSRAAQQLDYSVTPTGYSPASLVRPREFGLIARAAF